MILVTGGAGYIGSHFLLSCLRNGLDVAVVDDLSTGSRDVIPEGVPFILGDIANPDVLDAVFSLCPIRSVVHFAARISVPESIANPALYYQTNTVSSARLIDACVAHGVENFVFSSTAAVYGAPGVDMVRESAPVVPVSPYGRSKLAVEWMLGDQSAIGTMRTAVLRYFNVAGGDPEGRLPPGSRKAQHLIANVRRVVEGFAPELSIFGTDYDTRDGTCLRDYIHVSDLCDAHLIALDALDRGETGLVLNCGSGSGFTVKEVVDAASRWTGVPLPHRFCGRRVGDIPSLIARSDRLRAMGWLPGRSNIDDILRTALPLKGRAAA